MLTSKRLLLLPLTADQLELALRDLPTFQTYMAIEPQMDQLHLTMRQQGEKRLNQMTACPSEAPYHAPWLLLHQTLRQVVGIMGFTGPPTKDGSLELLYFTYMPYHGCGFMNEALSQLIPYCFNVLGVNKLTATTLRHNEASRHILEKQGFHPIFIDEINMHWQLYAPQTPLCL